ncbi:MAG: hypothetical protein MUO82_01140, partial [Candidatus Thermoplasmatota archaeon]|nr:hypothetical protein [Candidatus Thermoplasmatota archaeon]
MVKSGLEASVGMSRKWDAREAGREVARSTIEKLKAPPDFFILFSTIHYKKHGGFLELLNGAWDVLPENTPLIGGTVTGFMNNYGVYSRGATALAVSNPNMDVTIGYGKNTKRNPRKAARKCAKMIKNGLKDSKYENKFLLNLISASELPNMPPFKGKTIIKSGLTTKILMQLFGFSQYVFQKGAGRDDEAIEEMVKLMPEYSMLGGGTIDERATIRNYQFFNKNVFTNSIVTLGMKTKSNLDVLTTHNMKETGIKFEITKASKDGRIIHEINNKPAATEFLSLLNWPKDFLNDATWFKTNFYFPLSFHINKDNDKLGPRVIGPIIGESLTTTIRSKDRNASILTIDGTSLLKTIDDNLSSFPKNPNFGLIASCTTRLETLGNKIYKS